MPISTPSQTRDRISILTGWRHSPNNTNHLLTQTTDLVANWTPWNTQIPLVACFQITTKSWPQQQISFISWISEANLVVTNRSFRQSTNCYRLMHLYSQLKRNRLHTSITLRKSNNEDKRNTTTTDHSWLLLDWQQSADRQLKHRFRQKLLFVLSQ